MKLQKIKRRRIALARFSVPFAIFAAIALPSEAYASFTEFSWSPATAFVLEARELGSCTVLADGESLLVTGDNTANEIEIAKSEDGVQVTCDGVTEIFNGVEEVVVEAGEGNDRIAIDCLACQKDRSLFVVFGQGGADTYIGRFLHPFDGAPPTSSFFDGGPGSDWLILEAGSLATRFEATPMGEVGSIEVLVTDITSETELAMVSSTNIESAVFKGDVGDDMFQAVDPGLWGIEATVLGLVGDDGFLIIQTNIDTLFITENSPWYWDGGSGQDRFTFMGSSADEHYKITGVPDQEIPDPHILVEDRITGELIGDFFIQQTEEIRLETGAGDDRLDIAWDAALMSGLETFEADLGDGDDELAADLLPVLTPPGPEGVQQVDLEIAAGGGDDQIDFNHAAGNWIDLNVNAQLGSGDDRVTALLITPPEDSLPGPEGTRELQFELFAGDEDEVVIILNLTGGEFFDLSITAILEGGEDLLEALGDMDLLALPGEGFDVARVTPNLLQFVTTFEHIEVLERDP